MEGLEKTVDHVKNELMPEYDYDEYTRRHEEYQARKKEEASQAEAIEGSTKQSAYEVNIDEDLTW